MDYSNLKRTQLFSERPIIQFNYNQDASSAYMYLCLRDNQFVAESYC